MNRFDFLVKGTNFYIRDVDVPEQVSILGDIRFSLGGSTKSEGFCKARIRRQRILLDRRELCYIVNLLSEHLSVRVFGGFGSGYWTLLHG